MTPAGSNESSQPKIFTTTVMLGDRKHGEQLSIFARGIMKMISESGGGESEREMMLAIHVHDVGVETYRGVMECLKRRVEF